MKKVSALVLALVLVLSLAACGGSGEKKENTAGNAEAEVTLDKNDSANYLGTWTCQTSYKLTVNKGGIGIYNPPKDKGGMDIVSLMKSKME